MQFNILHLFLLFPWNESSSVWGSVVCLAEFTCYAISYTLMGLHKFPKNYFFFIKMKNAHAALRRLHIVAINPWKQKWFRQLVNWCLALRVLAGDTAWHTSSNTHVIVIVSSVQFGCPRGWRRAYLGHCAHVEKCQLSPIQSLFTGVRVFMSLPFPEEMKSGL